MDFVKLYLTTLDFYFRDSRGLGNFIEKYIKETVERFDTDYPIEEDIEESNPDFYHFLVDELSEKWWQFSRDYPSEFRASYIAQVFNGIDTHMAKICMLHHRVYEPEKAWFKINNVNEWKKKYRYLKTYAGVDFTDMQAEWDFLDEIRKIRNQIVHHHSGVSFNDKDWAAIKLFILSNSDIITFKDDGDELEDERIMPLHEVRPHYRFKFLIISPAFAELVIDTAESFFKKLLPQISFKEI